MASDRCFHSCYVTDVKTSGHIVEIKDSARGVWSLDLNEDPSLALQFKTWMEKIFLKGVPQTLTVFEYEEVGDDIDFCRRVKKFCNLPSD